MIYLALGAAGLFTVAATLVMRLRLRRTRFTLRQPEPLAFAHVRILRDHHEVQEVAHQAYARELGIADAARRRAARFGRLTQEGRGSAM